MHESGMIRTMLSMALAEAERRNAALIGIELRLGALAGGSPEHLREHFEHELARRGLAAIGLTICVDEAYPGSVDITGLELRAR